MKNLEEVLAIIPARGGSKGVPRKNVKLMNGYPMIYYTIDAALNSKFITRTIVSTDDAEIAEVAKKYKVDIIIRPKELAQDAAPTLPVLKHAVRYLKETENYHPDIALLLFPTYPLRRSEDIDKVIEKLIETKAESVCSVYETDKHPYWMSKLEGDKSFFFRNRKTRISRRQDLPKYYMLGGGIFAYYTKNLMKLKNTHFSLRDNRVIIMPAEQCIDVDNPKDFIIAEALMKNIP